MEMWAMAVIFAVASSMVVLLQVSSSQYPWELVWYAVFFKAAPNSDMLKNIFHAYFKKHLFYMTIT